MRWFEGCLQQQEKLAFFLQEVWVYPLAMLVGKNRAPIYFQDLVQDTLLGRIGKDTAQYHDKYMDWVQKGVDYKQALAEILDILSKHNLWLKLTSFKNSLFVQTFTNYPKIHSGWPSNRSKIWQKQPPFLCGARNVMRLLSHWKWLSLPASYTVQIWQ